MVTSYLNTYMEIIFGICPPPDKGGQRGRGGRNTYVVSFPMVLQEVKCPMSGCLSVVHSVVQLHEHFM